MHLTSPVGYNFFFFNNPNFLCQLATATAAVLFVVRTPYVSSIQYLFDIYTAAVAAAYMCILRSIATTPKKVSGG